MGKTQTPQWTAADIPDLRGRVAVVTGASAGLGVPTARMLAEHGATVVLACRNVEKAGAVADLIRQTAPEAELPIVRLDLASQASVRGAAEEIRERFAAVDLLINNAGTANTERIHTEDGFETTFATNHLGPFALTGLLLDRLLAAPAGRVVTVSSGTAGRAKMDIDDLFYERRRYGTMAAYGQSKLANQLFTFEFQRRLNGTAAALVAVAVQPGVAVSDFEANLGPVIRFLVNTPVKRLVDAFKQTPDMGALPSLRAAVDPTVRGGEFFGPTGRIKGYPVLNEPTATAKDPELAARLWVKSEELTGISYRLGETAGEISPVS